MIRILKINVLLQILLWAVFGSILVAFSYWLTSHKITELKEKQYSQYASGLKRETKTLIDQKSQTLRVIAITISKDKLIKEALLKNDPSILNLQEYSAQLSAHTTLKNIWYQILTLDGKSFSRSWTNKNGDDLTYARKDIAKLIKKPEIIDSISVGKYDLTFKTMVPIYDGQHFIGIVEVMGKLNSVAESLEQSGNSCVVLVNKSYKNQLTHAFTKQFLGDYYIANTNAQKSDLQLIEKNKLVDSFFKPDEQEYQLVDNHMVTDYKIFEKSGEVMASIVFLTHLDKINMEVIESTQNQMIVFVFFIFALFVGSYYAFKALIKRKYLLQTNQILANEVKEKTLEIQKQSDFLQKIIDNIPETIMVIDRDYNIQLMNEAARKQYSEDQVIQPFAKCYEVSHHISQPCDGNDHPCPLRESFQNLQTSISMHNHGEHFLELSTIPMFDRQDVMNAVLEIGRDITHHIVKTKTLQEHRDQLDYVAHHDSLTKLPNRIFFLDQLEKMIKNAQHTDGQVAILFLDLDRFKEVNDNYGHDIGDALLIDVAKRFSMLLRENDILSRLGGDEFTVVLDEISDLDDVVNIASRMIHALDEPVIIGELKLHLTCSIGISIYPNDGVSREVLLKNADTAMYRAKEAGKNRYEFYAPEMTEFAFERLSIENRLRNALINDEFVLYYQPQIDARNEKLFGMEVLVRWQDPQVGLILPNRFIHIAEETGLIIQIGATILRKAFMQMKVWSDVKIYSGKLAVNISIKQLEDKNFVPTVMKLLKETECPVQNIHFEITESLFMKNVEFLLSQLKAIKQLGIHLSLDDFGTGYSSLSYLKRFPIDELKIDRSFIQDIPGDEEDEEIVKAIVAMAKSLKMNILAEGIETNEQREFLMQNGCYLIQGYIYSVPLNGSEIENRYLKKLVEN